jgi:NodT family efflux transporter outer membrane factor (OMF) lipoprotein
MEIRMGEPRARRQRTESAALAVVLASLVLTGCGLPEWAHNGGKVGPNYKTPPAEVAANWIDYQDPRVTSQEQDLSRWWGVFGDPVLDSLVQQAYDQNLSLRVAGERVVEARARRGIAVGNLFPQLQEAAGSYSANKISDKVANGIGDQYFQNWNAGFNVAWELDLWGRFRRSIEAADADLEASVANYDDVLVVLLADVSANYVQYRILQERIAVAHRNVEIQSKSYQLAQDRFKAGAATERDTQQSRVLLEQTRALIPSLESDLRKAANALCVLLAIPPRDLSERLGAGSGVPVVPPELALGIPADLLRRRPDVRRSERQAATQSALIGVSKADMYPRLSLLGSIGVQAEDFSDLFHTPGSVAGSIGPAFHWDILNYGRLEGNVQIQESRYRQAVLAYQDTVLRAGREAEDAAVSFLKAQERSRYLGDSVTAATRTVQITYEQFSQGVVDFTPVFIFEERLAEREDDLVVARGQIALSLVDLYRALGGGWEMRVRGPGTGAGALPAPAPAPPTTAPVGGAPLTRPMPPGAATTNPTTTNPTGPATAPAGPTR